MNKSIAAMSMLMLCLVSPVAAQGKNEDLDKEFGKICSAKGDDKCWMKLATPDNCHVWHDLAIHTKFDLSRMVHDKFSWTGECLGGLAIGQGDLDIQESASSRWIRITTVLNKGRMWGTTHIRYWHGRNHSGSMEDHMRHGQWTRVSDKLGWLSRGPYVSGVRQGRWLERQPHTTWATVSEGQVKDGKREGFWITRDESGNVVGQTTYRADKPHGKSTLTYPDGKKVTWEWDRGMLIRSTAVHPSGHVEVKE